MVGNSDIMKKVPIIKIDVHEAIKKLEALENTRWTKSTVSDLQVIWNQEGGDLVIILIPHKLERKYYVREGYVFERDAWSHLIKSSHIKMFSTRQEAVSFIEEEKKKHQYKTEWEKVKRSEL